ncbi:hypothetical protein [Nocardia callitridis]|uniref:Uncharacterized protein n=1 Tax=Nocardia callitridis TaxID=648753 RepID=A0ABP9KRA2_9NOCA
MDSERDSPYWDAIVGDHWPEIGPGDWSELASTARAGAQALDVLAADQARKAFDEVARSGASVQAIKDEMAEQRGNPLAFAEALTAAAGTFGDFSDLVYRTRNRILDVVADATAKIRDASRPPPDGGDEQTEAEAEAEAARVRARIAQIVAEARREVAEVARDALRSISPSGLPSLGDVPRRLGRPGPWDPPARHRQAEPVQYPHSPRGVDREPAHLPIELFPDELWRLIDGLHPVVPEPDFPAAEQITAEVPRGEIPAAPSDASNTPYAPNQVPMSVSPSVSAPSMGEAPTHANIGALQPDSVPARSTPDNAAMPGRAGSTDPDPEATGRPHSGASLEAEPVSENSGATTDSNTVAGMDGAGGAGEDTTEGMSFPPPVLPGAQAGGTPSAVPSAPTQLRGVPNTPASASVSASNPSAVQARSAPEVRVAAPPKVSAGTDGSSAPGSSVSASNNKPQQQNRAVPALPGDRDNDEGRDESMRETVGAAMASAAVPAFLVGGARVDGDLVLARTILGGIVAAVGPTVVGLSLAVSVLRHPDGLGAFVTSNEGRGWLPSGLYLPREISTPWVWEVSDSSAWEGVADPARVLVEFGLAWGRSRGARLSAVVSTQPIEAGMRGQLLDVATEGEVGASAVMDLTTAGSSRVDRLGLVGDRQLVERVTRVPERSIGARCAELAWDAHVRLGAQRTGAAESLNAPQTRQRILDAVRHGRAVPGEWWDELQEVDDLLAASMLSRRGDVSRIALGELRSEDPQARTESAELRAMVFERRADELVSLLAQEPDRQCLRDAVYAYGQLIDHPLFRRTPTTATESSGGGARPTITVGPER